MWLRTDKPNDIEAEIADFADGNREDKQDAAWLNLETGVRIILVDVGGWRNAETSSYRVALAPPGGKLLDITEEVLGGPVAFSKKDEHGSNTYENQLRQARKYIDDLLGIDESKQRSTFKFDPDLPRPDVKFPFGKRKSGDGLA